MIVSSVVFLVLCLVIGAIGSSSAIENNFYERPGVIVSEILIARGYLAKDFYFKSMDGAYTLRITRGRNPLINGGAGGLPDKVPILFVHGILEDANIFVINSFDAQPKDWSNLNFSNMSIERLNAEFGDEPTAKSLPLLALNLGHEVYILSRRGFPGSQNMGDREQHHVSLPSDGNETHQTDPHALGRLDAKGGQPGNKGLIDYFTSSGRYMLGPFSAYLEALLEIPESLQQVPLSFSASFYNFSLDEQAIFDFPTAIDFVLNQTGRPKTAVVAHSAGGAITLMALSTYPELADKISSATLWAAAFNLGEGIIFFVLPLFLPLLDVYSGSFPPSFLTDQLQATIALICASPLTQFTLCEGIADVLLGPSGFKEPIKPEFASGILGPTSPHELAQLVRAPSYQMGSLHHFDFRSKQANQLAYGQDTPAAYDLSKIKLGTMSFYAGGGDQVVTAKDVARSIVQLLVPHRYHFVDAAFNHQGYFFHKNNSRLAIIPSMQEIEMLSQS